MINHSNRIEKICSLVQAQTVAEIGCDHAYILKNLFEKKLIDCAYATDISDLCLDKARKNLNKFLSNVYFYVGDGLEPLNNVLGQKVANFVPIDIIIAGMGGKEIIKIMSLANKFHRENVTFILQPQKNCDMVRRFLMEYNFKIEQDIVAKDGKMFYNILRCRINFEQNLLTDEQIFFGLGTQKDNDYYDYLNFEREKLEKILSKKSVKSVEEKLSLLKNICKEIENV